MVGTSGSSRSTLASLLAGLRTPRARAVALVTQDTHVFTGTIAENLRLARPDATDEELLGALGAVGTDWVDALPDGLSTLVGSGGAPLSAGQAQQLALARLLLLDPAVVVLDEATAEAGSDAARTLDRAAAVLRGRSGVIIARRLSQTATADTIVVMDGGRITETGTHRQPLDAGGAYAALWAAWSGTG